MENRDKKPVIEQILGTVMKISLFLLVASFVLSILFGFIIRRTMPAIVFGTFSSVLLIIFVVSTAVRAAVRTRNIKRYDYHRNQVNAHDARLSPSEQDASVSALTEDGIFEAFIDARLHETYHIFSDYKMFYKIGKQFAMRNARFNSIDSITRTYVDEYLQLLYRYSETANGSVTVDFQNNAWICFSTVVIKKFHGIYKSKLFNVKKSYEPYPSAVEAIADYVDLVSKNQLAPDDRMLLFYYLFLNKYLSGNGIQEAYDEFSAIFMGMQSSSQKQHALAIAKAKTGNVNDAAPKNDDDNDYTPISPNFRMYHLDLMSDTEFDRFIENVFNGLGYQTSHNAATDTCMIDFIAEREGERFSVMAKTSGLPFDEVQIRQLLDLFQTCHTQKGFLVTTGCVSDAVQALAAEGGLTVWTRPILEKILHSLTQKS